MKNKIKLLFALALFLALSFPVSVFAQIYTSNCVVTKVGNGGTTPSLPPECTGGVGVAGWPFATKNPTQYKRIDMGWDLQFNQPTAVFAVAPGIVSIAGNNPGGFGPDYTLLTLDTPIFGYPAIYFGHVHTDRTKVGKHVDIGDIIATTDPNGVNSPPNWLEIGFWNNGPAAQAVRDPESHYSPQGQQMHDWLINVGK